MTSPRITVILTVYKRTEYLAEALNSALAQSYADFEVIVADDSGTAAAREIVAACGQPEKVKYLPNATTLGAARSLAGAAGQARGEYIAILNDDDVWEREMLEELITPLLEDPDRVLASADHWIMHANGQINHDLSESWTRDFGRAGLPRGLVANALEFTVIKCGTAISLASIFRKDALDWSLVGPEIAGAYDYWITCLLAATRRPIYFVPKRLARWRVHGAMETGRRSHDKGENLVYILSTLLERGWFPELEAVLKAKLAEALYVVGRDKLQFDRAREARGYLWRSFFLKHRPRALAHAAASFLPGSARSQLKAALGVLRKSKPAAAKGVEPDPLWGRTNVDRPD